MAIVTRRSQLIAAGLMFGVMFVLSMGLWYFLVEVMSSNRRPDAGAPSALSPSPSDRTQLARIDALEQRVQELATRLEGLEGLGAPQRNAIEDASAPPPALPSGDNAPAETRGPEWYLQQYALSFQNGGKGSEYYRRNVEAYAPSLLRPIADIVVDERAEQLLRLSLIAMLGDARFSGQAGAIDLLLRLISTASDPLVLRAAVAALGEIGDLRAGASLERLIPGMPDVEAQREAVRVLLRMLGEGANAALARLIASSPDPALRAFLVSALRPNTPFAETCRKP